jgi:hypothetical protein
MPANNAGDVDKYRFPTVDFDSELVAYAFVATVRSHP